MFGGYGLYHEGQFFGIIMDGRLYFRAGEESRRDYLERGSELFVYKGKQKTVTMNYYEVPTDVLENRTELASWAKRAVEEGKTKRPRKKKGGTHRQGAGPVIS